LGFIRIPVIFGDVLKKKTREVFFLVDTGLFFPIIPLSLAEEFNIKPLAEVELILAILLYLGGLERAGLGLLGLLVVCLGFLRVRLGELLKDYQ